MRKGFTLVELSIVLVIIGLIVAGVTMGRDLVRGFQMRDLLGQTEEYIAAINTFKLKFNALPGDIENASVYFGQLSSGTCTTTTSTDGTTCGGDGDNQITFSGVTDPGGGGGVREAFRFWEHLALAGLYGGAYSGFSASEGVNGFDHVPGINSPATAFDSVSYSIGHIGGVGGTMHSQNFFAEGTNTHIFLIGDSSGLGMANGVYFTPPEMFSMDTKIDDGAAGMGQFQSRSNSGCVSQTDDADRATTEYLLTRQDIRACTIVFNLGPLN